MIKSLHNSIARKLIIPALLAAALFLPGHTPAAASRQFLNDRAAAITGAMPLAAPGLVAPGGLTGKGEIVGLADSGLDGGRLDDLHPDLQSAPGQMPKVVMLKSWADRELPDDPVGHGTHLAGIIAGSGAASDGRYRGIASGASIYFQGLLSAGGELAPPGELARLFRPAYEAGVRIHVNAWGGGPNSYRLISSQIDSFVHENPDFLPIFGAGNNGPVEGTLTTEANSKNALVVGASEIPRPAFSPDASDARRQAEFSSRGPTADRRLKPDLLAPGSALVSTRSRLAEANFPANRQYNVMSGTSQAAAVTGGAAAVLRQYLKANGFAAPSAALLKAALVNGAWTPAGGPTGAFPGILDLAGTVLALQEGAMQLEDDRQGLAEEEERTYQLQVTDSSRPVRVTLAWTDPPAAAGAAATLVNDLDLVVTGPNGKKYYGNDFSGQGKPDRRNNLEKVYIKEPSPGTYTIKVKAITVREDSPAGVAGQEFALAYGQPLARGVVSSATAAQVTLSDGHVFKFPSGGIKNTVNGRAAAANAAAILPGSEAYLSPRTLYLAGSRWRADGVQALTAGEENLFLEINSQVRGGGYYLDPAGTVNINGQAAQPADLPPGFSLEATLNPATETLWRVLAAYREQEGFLTRIDLEKGQLWLLGQEEPFVLSPQAAVIFADKLVDARPADLPYGAAERAEPAALVPGMAVRLVLQPRTGQVTYIAVKRELALGEVVRVEGGSITLAAGRNYDLFPGAPAKRDRENVKMTAVQPGDWAIITLVPGSDKIISLAAYSHVNYGRLIYVSNDLKTIYLLDYANQFRMYDLDDRTQVYRWGLPVSAATLSPGDWVRLTVEPGQNSTWRLDAATPAAEIGKTLGRLDTEASALYTADGSRYVFNEKTLVTLGGYRVNAADLPPGAFLNLTTLLAGAEEPILARVLAAGLPDSRPPQLAVSVLPGDEGYYLKGTTSAGRLYFNYEGEGQQVIPVGAGGNFQWPLPDGDRSFLLVAVNRADGGVTGKRIDPADARAEGFWDCRGHWAAADINAMVSRGLIAGYEDGSFRPNNPVTRVELVAFLARLAGWPLPGDPRLSFTDGDAIPAWARGAVAAAREHGLVDGYPDGTFRPAQPVSRVEAAAFFIRFLADSAPAPAPLLPYYDLEAIPVWGRESVARAYAAGLMRGETATAFAPLSPFTRAQTAAVLGRMN